MKDVKFSVVIPLYNKANHIHRALNSVLSQTVQEFEIIVIDDGSTDNGAEVVQNILDPRITLIRQDNAGVSAARNRGIEEANFDYVAFLDADDTWAPFYLETILRLIRAYPEAGIYATAYILKTARGEVVPTFYGIPKGDWEGLIPRFFESAALGPTPVWTSAVCMPKKVLTDIGAFPLGEKLGEDLDLWSRVALQYQIAFSSYPGAEYFLAADNRACANSAPQDELPFCKRLQAKLNNKEIPFELVDDVKLFIARHLIHVAATNIQIGNRRIASRILMNRRTNLFWKEKILWGLWLLLPLSLMGVAKKNLQLIRRFLR